MRAPIYRPPLRHAALNQQSSPRVETKRETMASSVSDTKTPARIDFVPVQIVASAVLAVLLVALSASGRRFRHPVLRVVLWGTSTAFLPLTSSALTGLLAKRKAEDDHMVEHKSGSNSSDVRNMWTLLLWSVLIIVIKGNADTAAASAVASAATPSSDDSSVDGQKVRTPVELLFKYAWLGYLTVLCIPEAGWWGPWRIAIFFAFIVLGCAKVVLKLGGFFLADRSYAVGNNARLVSGYMAQLVESGEEDGHGHVPPYIVMGESGEHVEESPSGFRIKREALDNKSSALVTLDRVWRLSDQGDADGLLAKRRELRDLCLSFSLFKSLRRRLAGYPLAEEGSSNALDFFLRGMDTAAGEGKGDGADAGADADASRVFRILVDELCFASDFYYSPLPLCSFSGWCAALNYLLSVLIVAGAVTVGWIYQERGVVGFKKQKYYFVITFLLLLAVVLTETWEIIAGVCSNWTKMALLGHYITRESCRGRAAAALDAVLRFRPARRWSDKIGQNSVLEPRRFGRRSGFYTEKLYGGAGLMRSVEVPPSAKDAVLRSMMSSYGGMNKGNTAARRVVLGGKVDWAWPPIGSDDGIGSTTEHILACHIGTRLFEIKYSHAAPTSAAADMAAAGHLSNYCAYLVAAAPGLLPDSIAWTEKRYKDVEKDVKAALVGEKEDGAASESSAQRFERLLKKLSASSRDKVLQRGAEHGIRLVEAYEEDSATAWRFLADFWSEMVLFVAPSKNVKGHVEAMGRGGEFVTLVWALLLHAGVTDRPETTGSTIP